MKISEIWGKRDMKKSLYFAFFVNFVFLIPVFSENVNWYVGDNLYTTTTCEIGNDILLPVAPTKTGYVFRGWREKTNRGIFNTWNDVPTQTQYYQQDSNEQQTPLIGDYITIIDSSNYPSETLTIKAYSGKVVFTYHNQEETALMKNIPTNTDAYFLSGLVSVNRSEGYGSSGCTIRVFRNGLKKASNSNTTTQITSGDNVSPWRNADLGSGGVVVVGFTEGNFTGTWRYVYDGDWDIDNVAGWKPVAQIE